jgi:hypothetical protein
MNRTLKPCWEHGYSAMDPSFYLYICIEVGCSEYVDSPRVSEVGEICLAPLETTTKVQRRKTVVLHT